MRIVYSCMSDLVRSKKSRAYTINAVGEEILLTQLMEKLLYFFNVDCNVV